VVISEAAAVVVGGSLVARNGGEAAESVGVHSGWEVDGRGSYTLAATPMASVV
jgi:hypothetical protein